MRKVRVRAIIEHESEFLFVRHHHHENEIWALPGGHLDSGETLEDGITRELVEELGIKPVLGRVLYIHQLFMHDHESLEFFFEVLNGGDYRTLDLAATSHGELELAEAAFIDPADKYILPEFLAGLADDLTDNVFPKVYVRHASTL